MTLHARTLPRTVVTDAEWAREAARELMYRRCPSSVGSRTGSSLSINAVQWSPSSEGDPVTEGLDLRPLQGRLSRTGLPGATLQESTPECHDIMVMWAEEKH